MLIAFYGQGILSFTFFTWIDILVCFFPKKKLLRKWLESLQAGLITDWVTMGLAMIIAALTQWRTISMFHLFICASLAITIPTEGAGWEDIIAWERDRLQFIFLMCFRMLRIAILSYLIYRFVRLWSNTPGQCFILSVHTSYPDNIKFPITLIAFCILSDASFGIRTLFYITSTTCRQHVAAMDELKKDLAVVPDATLDAALDRLSKDLNADLNVIKMIFGITAFLTRSFGRGTFAMINSAYSIWLVFANRGNIVGDEYILGFGQVAALVTLGASLYKIWISFDSRSCVPS